MFFSALNKKLFHLYTFSAQIICAQAKIQVDRGGDLNL